MIIIFEDGAKWQIQAHSDHAATVVSSSPKRDLEGSIVYHHNQLRPGDQPIIDTNQSQFGRYVKRIAKIENEGEEVSNA